MPICVPCTTKYVPIIKNVCATYNHKMCFNEHFAFNFVSGISSCRCYKPTLTQTPLPHLPPQLHRPSAVPSGRPLCTSGPLAAGGCVTRWLHDKGGASSQSLLRRGPGRSSLPVAHERSAGVVRSYSGEVATGGETRPRISRGGYVKRACYWRPRCLQKTCSYVRNVHACLRGVGTNYSPVKRWVSSLRCDVAIRELPNVQHSNIIIFSMFFLFLVCIFWSE